MLIRNFANLAIVEGVRERMEFEESAFCQNDKSKATPSPYIAPSRRRKGSAFCEVGYCKCSLVSCKDPFSYHQNTTIYRQE